MRQPANTPSTTPTTGAAGSPAEALTAESLGWQLRASLPPLRLHSVSVYDEQANVLWLSEGALGPDEHSVVLEAIRALEADASLPWHENGLDDGRMGIFLAVRAPQGALVGMVMILADAKSVSEGLTERLITPNIRTLLQKLAVFLRPISVRATHTGRTLPVLELAPELQSASPAETQRFRREHAPIVAPASPASILELEMDPTPAGPNANPPERRKVARPPRAADPVGHPGGPTDTMMVPTLSAAIATEKAPVLAHTTPSVATTSSLRVPGSTMTSRVLTLPEGVNLVLEVQPYVKLRAGGLTKRFEVQARTVHLGPHRAPDALDSLIVQRLLTWLGSNRAAWNSAPTSFTLNLSITTLEDERFPNFVASHLKAQGIAPESLGFEISEPLCVQRRAQVERFVARCDKLGCFMSIDDFSWDSSVMPLLRSKALRMVKIDPKLTSVALKDKLAQAVVVGIAQASKVLGIHCAAKQVESAAALQWLTAIGCDFAQGPAVCALQPLETLASASAT